ncbi:hypothetical protein Vafri_21378 [Volvox africanus]|uniref:VTT domain-containing protein n=1 Tax=Volvox africanus TaxID=51714 RepID=A0A8J4BU76_9CHLO|nr:hypothetical protein Vafri_21378 [Volvox africanus]
MLNINMRCKAPLANSNRSLTPHTTCFVAATRAKTAALLFSHQQYCLREICSLSPGGDRRTLAASCDSSKDASVVEYGSCDGSERSYAYFGRNAPLVSFIAALTAGLLVAPGDAEAMSLSGLADAAVEAVASSGWLGPAVFVVLYVAATVLLLPASVLTLAAGALFGPVAGTALVSLASTTGAIAAFLVSRYFARPWVERQISGNPRFKAVLSGVAARGAYVVLLLRLSPLVPFNLLNYALGLTTVPLLPYVVSSWVGMLPGTFAYVYLGGAGKAAVTAAAGGGGGGADTTQLVLYGVGAVATILATRLISSAASKALEEDQPGRERDADS